MLAEWVKTRMKVTEVHDRPLTQGSVILQATRTRTRQTRQTLPNSSPRLLGEPPLPAGPQIPVWDVEHWSPPFGSVVRTTKVEALGVNPYLDLDSSQELLRGSYSFPLHPGPPWMNEVAGVLGWEGAELFESCSLLILACLCLGFLSLPLPLFSSSFSIPFPAKTHTASAPSPRTPIRGCAWPLSWTQR